MWMVTVYIQRGIYKGIMLARDELNFLLRTNRTDNYNLEECKM